MSGSGPVAIVVWGDVVEDYLSYLSLDLRAVAERISGGWLFGYVAALASQGQASIVVFLSSQFDKEVHLVNASSGARIVGLPTSWVYRQIRLSPSGERSSEDAGPGGPLTRGRHLAAPYLETPVLRLAGLLRREACTAVICQEYEYARFDVMVAIGRVLGVPVFGCFQGAEPSVGRLQRAIRPSSIRACAGLIVGASAEARRVRTTYRLADDKIARIPNPVDGDAWCRTDRAVTRAELGLPTDCHLVAWHGRVEIAFKGLDVLVDACERLAGMNLDRQVKLLMIGSGSDAAQLARRVESARPGLVVWRTEYVVDAAELARLLSAADLYAFPSRREGFPMAPLEAMACGLPVVAADASGVRDIFLHGERSGGVVVPRDDADAFAGAMHTILADDQLRATMAVAARRRVETGFRVDQVGRLLATFFARNDAIAPSVRW